MWENRLYVERILLINQRILLRMGNKIQATRVGKNTRSLLTLSPDFPIIHLPSISVSLPIQFTAEEMAAASCTKVHRDFAWWRHLVYVRDTHWSWVDRMSDQSKEGARDLVGHLLRRDCPNMEIPTGRIGRRGQSIPLTCAGKGTRSCLPRTWLHAAKKVSWKGESRPISNNIKAFFYFLTSYHLLCRHTRNVSPCESWEQHCDLKQRYFPQSKQSDESSGTVLHSLHTVFIYRWYKS